MSSGSPLLPNAISTIPLAVSQSSITTTSSPTFPLTTSTTSKTSETSETSTTSTGSTILSSDISKSVSLTSARTPLLLSTSSATSLSLSQSSTTSQPSFVTSRTSKPLSAPSQSPNTTPRNRSSSSVTQGVVISITILILFLSILACVSLKRRSRNRKRSYSDDTKVARSPGLTNSLCLFEKPELEARPARGVGPRDKSELEAPLRVDTDDKPVYLEISELRIQAQRRTVTSEPIPQRSIASRLSNAGRSLAKHWSRGGSQGFGGNVVTDRSRIDIPIEPPAIWRPATDEGKEYARSRRADKDIQSLYRNVWRE